MKSRTAMSALLLVLPGLGGCSVFDATLSSNAPRLDPTKIYLEDEAVTVRPSEMENYACFDSPLLCKGFGLVYDCTCLP